MNMIKKSVFFLVLILLLAGCSQESAVQEGYFPGDKAPDFTLQMLNEETLTLSELSGKSVMLVFWASW